MDDDASLDHPIAAAYRGVRLRLTALADDQPPEALERTVPACPAWQVRDVLAHLAGACEDILAGNLDGVATDAWTEAQVERHRHDAPADLLATWAELGPRVEELAPHIPPGPASQLVFDAATHEADVRGALGAPGARDSDAVHIGLGFLLGAMDGLVRHQGLPALRVDLGDEVRDLGDGPPAAVLSATPFEVLRALGGRRSLAQVRSLTWDGDPAPYEALLRGDILHAPDADLLE